MKPGYQHPYCHLLILSTLLCSSSSPIIYISLQLPCEVSVTCGIVGASARKAEHHVAPERVIQPHSGFVHRGCPKEPSCCAGKGIFKFPMEELSQQPLQCACCAPHFVFILFSGIDHVSIRLDLETLFQFSHLILTFKVHLLPELLCNVIH